MPNGIASFKLIRQLLKERGKPVALRLPTPTCLRSSTLPLLHTKRMKKIIFSDWPQAEPSPRQLTNKGIITWLTQLIHFIY